MITVLAIVAASVLGFWIGHREARRFMVGVAAKMLAEKQEEIIAKECAWQMERSMHTELAQDLLSQLIEAKYRSKVTE